MEKVSQIIDEIGKGNIPQKLDSLTEVEKIQIDLWEVERDKKRSEFDSMEDDRKARKIFSVGIFIFVILYMTGVFILLVFERDLSEKVLIALLSTATANVIGLLMGVVRYIFPR